jgi:hypothetical protein
MLVASNTSDRDLAGLRAADLIVKDLTEMSVFRIQTLA